MFLRSIRLLGSQAIRNMATEVESKGGKTVMTGERSVNQATLLGRAGRNAELRGTEERPVAIFPLATSISIRRPDDTYEQKTEWHKIAVFRPGLREMVASSITSGARVFVTGTINYSTYEQDGRTITSTSIIADNVISLTPKKEQSEE